MVRINFQPYTTPQLEAIVKARLLAARNAHPPLPADAPDVIAPDALKFAAMKVASISGDASCVLNVFRYTSSSCTYAPSRRARKTWRRLSRTCRTARRWPSYASSAYTSALCSLRS